MNSDDQNQNDPEFDDDAFDDFGDDNFEEFKSDNTLGNLLQDPKAKIGAILAGAAVIFGIIVFLSGGDEQTATSRVASGSSVSTPPGTEEAPEAYVEAVREHDQQRLEEAIRTNTSVLPTPITPAQGTLSVPDSQKQEEDPLVAWRRLQQERVRNELQNAPVVAPPPVNNDAERQESIQALADLMAQQMQAILDQHTTPVDVSYVGMTGPDWLEAIEAEEQALVQASLAEQNLQAQIAAEQLGREILVPAGEIEYAQLITEANSDTPGPVLAEIMSGPLRGSRILGDFDVQNDYLTLNFSTVVIDGESYSLDAVGLDPDTTLPGMATEYDPRLLQRIFLPMAAAFVENAANAFAEAGTTTVTINNETVTEDSEDTGTDQEIASGISEAGAELRDYLDELQNDLEPLVRIEAGTPMGILFLQPVIEGGNDVPSNAQSVNPLAPGQAIPGVPGAAGFTGVNGVTGFNGVFVPTALQPAAGTGDSQ